MRAGKIGILVAGAVLALGLAQPAAAQVRTPRMPW